ncbi:cytochrome P450 family protein [Alkaliphilus metalliredigens QYMF]|uniref:Cytochrome P450 family protein n=1 Tax=Alkaliphilus metalliredigens (strain QYMF) TaxID=293826 RepID=A6TTE9_ALKMQ|nr:cytochrome P450 family protein [Alkaliphilus metalliredigens QYMF]
MRDGYLFIKKKAEQNQTDLFETSLLDQNIVFMSGEEAVKIFYDPEV